MAVSSVLTDNAPGLRATLRLPKIAGAGPGPVPEMAFAGCDPVGLAVPAFNERRHAWTGFSSGR